MKSIYVIIKGRSGNVLFQYAFARQLQELTGGEIILDFSEIGFNKSAGQYGPDKHMDNILDYFNVKNYIYADIGAPYKGSLCHRAQVFVYKVLRKVYVTWPQRTEIIAKRTNGILQRLGIYYQFSEYSLLGNHKPPAHLDSILVRGWFESAAYFNDIQGLLRNELHSIVSLPTGLKGLHHTLSNEESICVHVRRGDFLSNAFKNEFQICTLDYYKRGVSLITDLKPDTILYICSDDIDWCKDHLKFEGCKEVFYEPPGLSIAETMQLMVSCHHFVISNSTLSFWIQYLSNHPGKMVVAPSLWRRSTPPVKEIYMKEWNLIDCQ